MAMAACVARLVAQVELVHQAFSKLEFVQSLGSRLLQLQLCRYLGVRTIETGAVLFMAGDIGDVRAVRCAL